MSKKAKKPKPGKRVLKRRICVRGRPKRRQAVKKRYHDLRLSGGSGME